MVNSSGTEKVDWRLGRDSTVAAVWCWLTCGVGVGWAAGY